MFAAWQSFFQMTGEVAATLIGLLFIVVTLVSGRPSETMMRGMRLFTTPTVFHLVSVLVISAIALVPDGGDRLRGGLMAAWAMAGLADGIHVTRRLRAIEDPTHWSDFWWYGATPVGVYLALAAAGWSVWSSRPHAPSFIAAALMLLLLVTIRNAWDLVTWLAPRREGV